MSAPTKTLILGGGMIGSAMARDLAADPSHEVTVADSRPEVLAGIATRCGVETLQADLGSPEAVRRVAEQHDLVIGALPSVLGYRTLSAVIDAGVDYVDISFMAEDALELSEKAKAAGVTAVVDCGVAPGVSNLMVGHAVAQMDRCEHVEIYVGGLPLERHWPFEYKAGFAPHDVIEEYVRPSRLVEHGRVVVKEALSEPELMELKGIGTLEAFNTDGLRSLVQTIPAPFMKEKTLRYPGHIALMRVLRDLGLFSKDTVQVSGQSIRPLDLTAALMFPKWTFGEGEADLTVLRVIVEGVKGEKVVRYSWDLVDRYDEATGLRSMSRTTAFPATLVARLLAKGEFRRPGVHPPETLGGQAGILETVLDGLRARGVQVTPTAEKTVGTVSPALAGARA